MAAASACMALLPSTVTLRSAVSRGAAVAGSSSAMHADAAATAAFGLAPDAARRLVRGVLGDAELIPLA